MSAQNVALVSGAFREWILSIQYSTRFSVSPLFSYLKWQCYMPITKPISTPAMSLIGPNRKIYLREKLIRLYKRHPCPVHLQRLFINTFSNPALLGSFASLRILNNQTNFFFKLNWPIEQISADIQSRNAVLT
jgi:hypothetical protein